MSFRGIALAMLAWACSGAEKTEHVSALERGQELFEDGSASAYGLSCSTCHPQPQSAEQRIYPGGDLRGVTQRTSFWGGQENDLLRAVNHCRSSFQGFDAALQADEPGAVDLWAYLESLEGPPDPLEFTVVVAIRDVEAGDAANGSSLFDRTCRGCHGTMHDAEGRLDTALPTLPEDAVAKHEYLTAEEQRVVVIEKVRHGGFFGYTGNMPPFSLEALPDAELSDLLSALGLDPP
jgi:thiosulfate dehydrogenase